MADAKAAEPASARAVALTNTKHQVSKRPVDPAEGIDLDQSANLDDRSPLLETYYLHVDDKFEADAARAWMTKNAPEVPWGNLLNVLPLNELTTRSVVFVLVRLGTRQHPVAPVQPVTGRNPEGYLVHQTKTPQEIAEGMGAYGPVAAEKHWNRRGGRMSGGGLKNNDFTDEITDLARPYMIGWRDASEKNDGTYPNKLYLRIV